MKAKVLSKIMRLEEYAQLVARAVAVRVCPLCGCALGWRTYTWAVPKVREWLERR